MENTAQITAANTLDTFTHATDAITPKALAGQNLRSSPSIFSSLKKALFFPTLLGCIALFVWSLYAVTVSELLAHLPVFQTLFLMFGVSFFAMSIRLTVSRRWHIIKQPILLWVVGIVGVCGSDFAYVTAVKFAPPAHVDFIDYLWPFFVIVFASFLPKEKLSLKDIIAGGLGFLGVFLLLSGGKGLFGFQSNYFPGYCFAFVAALIWSAYTLITRLFENTPMEMTGLYCGFGAFTFLGLHLCFESWVWPTWSEGLMVGLLGLSSGMAYLLWNHATQKGNIKLLGILAYFTPIISMSLLVLTGKEPLTIMLIFSCLLVLSGVVVGSLNWTNHWTNLRFWWNSRRKIDNTAVL